MKRVIILIMLLFLVFSVDTSAHGVGAENAGGITPVFDEETGDLISFDYTVKSTEGTTGIRYKTDKIVFEIESRTGAPKKAIFNRQEIVDTISPVLSLGDSEDGVASVPVELVAQKMGVSEDQIRSEIINGDDFGVRAHVGIYRLGSNGWDDATKMTNIPYWNEAARDRLRDIGFGERDIREIGTRFRMGDVDVPTDPGDPVQNNPSGHYMEFEASFVHPIDINNPENDPVLSGSRIVYELTKKSGYGIPIVAEVGDFIYKKKEWEDEAGQECGACSCSDSSKIRNFEVHSMNVYIEPSGEMKEYWEKPIKIADFDVNLERVTEDGWDNLYSDKGNCLSDEPNNWMRFVLPKSAFPQKLRNFYTIPDQEDGTYTLKVILDIDATYDEYWCDEVPTCEYDGTCCSDSCDDGSGCCDVDSDYDCEKDCGWYNLDEQVPNNSVELELEISGSMFDDDETNITY